MIKCNPIRKRPPINSLINLINGLNNEQRQQLAKNCNTSVGNLRQIAYGFGGCSLSLAMSICKACDNVQLEQLLPELKEQTNER